MVVLHRIFTSIETREDDNEEREDFPELTGGEDEEEWHDERDIPKYCPGCAYMHCRCELL